VLLLAVPPTRPTVDASLTTVAKAIVQALFLAGFSAERRYLPRRKLEDYATLRVTVVARGDDMDVTDGNRTARLRTYTIDVAYQQRLVATEAAAEEAELDAHEGAVNAIMDALDPAVLPTAGGARIIGVTRYASDEAPYSMKHLAEARLYTAVVKLTLEEYREAA
jgi:hypothetical protein